MFSKNPFSPSSRLAGALANWFWPGRWPRWLVYVFAVAAVVAVLLLRLALEETFGEPPLLILFVLPILLSAYLGGLGPGLASTLAAAAVSSYLVISPQYTFSIAGSGDLTQWIGLIIIGGLLSGLIEALHHFWRRLETSRLLQAVTLASIGNAVITTDHQGWITFLNPEAEHLTGWSCQEAVGQPLPTVFRIINGQSRQAEEEPVKKVLAAGKLLNLADDTILLARDGRDLAIKGRGTPFQHSDGTLLGLMLVFHDCSEQRQAEAALRDSEERFRAFMDNSPALAWAKDEAGRYVYLSKVLEDRFGVRGEDWRGKTDFELWPPEIAEKFRENDLAALSNDTTVESLEETLDSEGRRRSWWIFKFPFQAASAQRFVGGIAVDITERQQAESALRASEEKYRLVMEAIQEGVWDWDIPTGELYISPSFLHSFGHDPEEVDYTYSYWEAAIHPEDLPSYQELLQDHLAGNNPSFEAEFRGRTGDGGNRWFSCRGRVVVRAADGAPLRMVGAVYDITEKKLAQAALEESLSLYQATLESTADGLLVVDNMGRLVSWNQKFLDMWRVPEEVISSGEAEKVRTFVADQLQDPEEFLRRAKELFVHQEAQTCDLLLFKDGRMFERYTIPQYFNGQITGRVLSFRDVTARVQAEAALKKSESRYRQIVETANEGIWALDTEYHTIYVNNLMAEMLGYSWEEMQGRPVTDFMFLEDLPDHYDKIERRQRGKFERRLRRRDGSALWTIVSVRALKGEDGEFQGSFAMLTDITERKRAEKALRASEEKYRLVFENAPLGIMHYDQQGTITDLNDKFAEIIGAPKEKIIGFNMPRQLLDDQMRQAVLDSLTKGSGYYEGEYVSVTGGKKTPVRTFYRSMFSETGAFLGGVSIFEDYTEKSRMEQEVRGSLNFLQILMDAIPYPVFYKDTSGIYLGGNKACEESWGRARQDFIGKSVFDLHPHDLAEIYHAKDAELFNHPGFQKYETSMAHSDGNRKDVILHKATFHNLDGSVGGLIGVEVDITERKRAEGQILASLKEKEVMLQEIHHRVKNNMQMISTLFDLQLKYGGAQDPPTMFRDCQNRIRSMALVHESLYHTDTLASINFRSYLEKLVNRLLVSFGSSVQGISATVEGAELHLGINQAVPAGLVASEIIVNCLKHAFPDQRSGEILISLAADDGRRVIEIKDNGVGLDGDFPLENPTSFGWLMITNLMKQLEGAIDVTGADGTTCRLVF